MSEQKNDRLRDESSRLPLLVFNSKLKKTSFGTNKFSLAREPITWEISHLFMY